jgi:hypothetical protein
MASRVIAFNLSLKVDRIEWTSCGAVRSRRVFCGARCPSSWGRSVTCFREFFGVVSRGAEGMESSIPNSFP